MSRNGQIKKLIKIFMENEKQKFNVSIEQPMCKTFEVEANSIDEALEIAREKWNSEEFIIGPDDIGTDAQIMAESADGAEATEWTDL